MCNSGLEGKVYNSGLEGKVYNSGLEELDD